MNIEGLYYKIITFAIWSNITKPEFWEFLVQPARKVISSSQFLCLCLSVGSMSQTPRPYCLSAVSYWLYNLGRDLMDFFFFFTFCDSSALKKSPSLLLRMLQYLKKMCHITSIDINHSKNKVTDPQTKAILHNSGNRLT